MSKKMTAVNSDGYQAPIGLAADPVIFTVRDGALHVLLARRAETPHRGEWALPGGFVGYAAGHEEDPVDTISRKLHEKTGMGTVYVEQLRTYAAPLRDERGWLPSVAYLALVPAEALPEDARHDAGWHAVADCPSLPFGHNDMIADGQARLRGKLWYSNVACGLLPQQFTVREAMAVYSAIVGEVYDHPSNFLRDLQRTGLVQATGAKRSEGPGRPAALYEFVGREPVYGELGRPRSV